MPCLACTGLDLVFCSCVFLKHEMQLFRGVHGILIGLSALFGISTKEKGII